MLESRTSSATAAATTTTTAFAACSAVLAGLDPDVDDATRIDRIRALEELRAQVAAVQARETAAFVTSQRAIQRAVGVPSERVGRGVAAQIALARRISPHAAARYVSAVMVLTGELPATFTALAAGKTSERRALIVAKESAWLSRSDRATVDAQLAPRLERLGDRAVEGQAKQAGYRLDPAGAVKHLQHVQGGRYVSLRPAPDTMTYLTALLPVAQGVAAYAALSRAADTAKAAGDPRTRGQVMADTLTRRTTGQTSAAGVPVAINLIMSEQTMFGIAPRTGTRTGTGAGSGADEPALLTADGVTPIPIPAALARRALTDTTGETSVFLRRLYTRPDTGQLVAMDSQARRFNGNLRQFLILRDQYCRTPWCGAPIRHLDHITPHTDGGATTATDGQGLCEACNHTKQAPHWTQDADPATGTIATTAPTGHTYTSDIPPPPGSPPPSSPPEGPDQASRQELPPPANSGEYPRRTRDDARARGRPGRPRC